MTRDVLPVAIVFAVFVVLLVAVTALPQERIVLTTPILAVPGATDFRVVEIRIHRDLPGEGPGGTTALFQARFHEVEGNAYVVGGKTAYCTYTGAEAETVIRLLNRMDFSTNSMEKRVIQRCQADNKLGAGSIVGVPQ